MDRLYQLLSAEREGKAMANKIRLRKETFLSIAKAAGLDTKDTHIEELYAYIQTVFPNFKVSEEIDLTGVEPIVTFIPSKE
jgi:Asp-tRNA(Asn)/Glu-tRNA(Gln) amidotransferase C subunit